MKYHEIALKAALKAGEILRTNFPSELNVEGKGVHDIVTESDRESEQAILSILKRHFPDHSIIAEESGTHQTGSDYTWYVDPLDGTSNFATGNPYFSVSIALAYKREVILGIVYNPIVNELYTAEKGKGAFLNNRLIHVNKKNTLSDALISSVFSPSSAAMPHDLETIGRLAVNSRKVLMNFSPALDLCNIARGKLDGIVDNCTTPEDHAAGSIILTEAGGIAENFSDQLWNVNNPGIIATNGPLQDLIAKLVRR